MGQHQGSARGPIKQSGRIHIAHESHAHKIIMDAANLGNTGEAAVANELEFVCCAEAEDLRF